MGTILIGGGDSLVGGQGATNCPPAFYKVSSSLGCLQGTAYPMVYFEPETASSNYLENLVFLPNQSYQTAIYMDEQLNGDGVVALRFEHVHLNGGLHSFPVVNKGGFGFFWNYGGWSAAGGNFSESVDYLITHNCGCRRTFHLRVRIHTSSPRIRHIPSGPSRWTRAGSRTVYRKRRHL